MQNSQISIQVPEDVAKAFLAASKEDRDLALSVFTALLRPREKAAARRDLERSWEILADDAAESGLTETQLGEILAEDQD